MFPLVTDTASQLISRWSFVISSTESAKFIVYNPKFMDLYPPYKCTMPCKKSLQTLSQTLDPASVILFPFRVEISSILPPFCIGAL